MDSHSSATNASAVAESTVPPAMCTPSQNDPGYPAQAMHNATSAVETIKFNIPEYSAFVGRIQKDIQQLSSAAEALHTAYNNVHADYVYYVQKLESAEQKLGEVQKIVQKYAVVREPVVASDGFTYEKDVIRKYLQECDASNTPPMSQQTNDKLTSVLIPNHSLKKLVDLLKVYKPSGEPRRVHHSDNQYHGSSGYGKNSGNANGNAHNNSSTGSPSNSHKHNANPGANSNANVSSNANAGSEGRHPCLRVYGFCNYKESCTYAQYPYDACLSHLKGKCRFGDQCHERHVELKQGTSGGGRNFNSGNSRKQS